MGIQLWPLNQILSLLPTPGPVEPISSFRTSWVPPAIIRRPEKGGNDPIHMLYESPNVASHTQTCALKCEVYVWGRPNFGSRAYIGLIVHSNLVQHVSVTMILTHVMYLVSQGSTY